MEKCYRVYCYVTAETDEDAVNRALTGEGEFVAEEVPQP